MPKLETEFPCPKCMNILNGVDSAFTEKLPEPGDVTICLHCESILEFKDDLSFDFVSEKAKEELKEELMVVRHYMNKMKEEEKSVKVEVFEIHDGEIKQREDEEIKTFRHATGFFADPNDESCFRKMPGLNCPGCGYDMDNLLAPNSRYTPGPGDFVMCSSCKILLRFQDDMSLLKAPQKFIDQNKEKIEQAKAIIDETNRRLENNDCKKPTLH